MNDRNRYVILLVLATGSFIGIWHALPMLNVVGDEQYFVGGVLRAVEAKSIFPPYGDVPYGTLTFYANYLLQLPFLLILLVWKGFHLLALKTFLIMHPEVAYFVPRFLSAVLAALFVWRYEHFLRREGLSFVHRFVVLSVPLMTILSAVILHTGKMWVLSFILVMGSMLALYTTLTYRSKRSIYWSILLACAAFANFPLAGLFLVVIPILLFIFRRDRILLRTTLCASILGGVGVLAVFAVNYKNIFYQIRDIFTKYHPLVENAQTTLLPHASLFPSIILHTQQILVAFPLVLLLLVVAVFRRAIANKLLFYLSLGYAVLYVAVLMLLATWSGELGTYLRYLFPLGFLFSAMIASFEYGRLRTTFVGFLIIQIGIYIYLLFLLSVPTTFNNAHDYVVQNYSSQHVLIYNDIVELELPQNAQSALLVQDRYCGSKCQYLRTSSTTLFAPVVVNYQSSLEKVQPTDFAKRYWIQSSRLATACAGEPIAIFQTGATDGGYFSIEYNLGNYFLPDFWHLSRLGKNIYIYQVPVSCFKEL